MEEIRVFIEHNKGKITCICKASNKGCGKSCDRDIMYYDKYKDIKECFKNKGDKTYKGAN